MVPFPPPRWGNFRFALDTGVVFPFFGTMIGWLGVALSGTDAGSNALFGSLQMIAANKLAVSPVLMGVADCADAVMGKIQPRPGARPVRRAAAPAAGQAAGVNTMERCAFVSPHRSAR